MTKLLFKACLTLSLTLLLGTAAWAQDPPSGGGSTLDWLRQHFDPDIQPRRTSEEISSRSSMWLQARRPLEASRDPFEGTRWARGNKVENVVCTGTVRTAPKLVVSGAAGPHLSLQP